MVIDQNHFFWRSNQKVNTDRRLDVARSHFQMCDFHFDELTHTGDL
jgi:hypothetical protein